MSKRSKCFRISKTSSHVNLHVIVEKKLNMVLDLQRSGDKIHEILFECLY